MSQWRITYLERGGRPKVTPNPAFPDGVRVGEHKEGRAECVVSLPYPNPNTNIGAWICECSVCGLRVAITAAARPDDPHSAIVPCKSPKVMQ